jgi:hypothetical protein
VAIIACHAAAAGADEPALKNYHLPATVRGGLLQALRSPQD